MSEFFLVFIGALNFIASIATLVTVALLGKFIDEEMPRRRKTKKRAEEASNG